MLEGFNTDLIKQKKESANSKTGHLKLVRRAKKKKKKNEETLRVLWSTNKWVNIHIKGVPEGEERKQQKAYLKKKND